MIGPRRRSYLTLALAVAAVAALANCSPNRTRPGPPRLTVDIPDGTSVFSPDTFVVEVLAVDADGLDSLTVLWGNQLLEFDPGFNIEATASVELFVPQNLAAGTILTVWVRARDVYGQASDEIVSLTVVDPSA